MAFELPAETTQMRASNLPGQPTPYLLKGLEDNDSAWNLVESRPSSL
jgi:hypothetical protein